MQRYALKKRGVFSVFVITISIYMVPIYTVITIGNQSLESRNSFCADYAKYTNFQ